MCAQSRAIDVQDRGIAEDIDIGIAGQPGKTGPSFRNLGLELGPPISDCRPQLLGLKCLAGPGRA
jgi:hypothetical protein